MVQPLGYLKESASQTAGPYVHIGCTPNFVGIEGVFETDLGSGPLYNDKTKGERITVRGFVFDGSGTPLKDALIEIWQADADGLYNSPSETRGSADPNFLGWGRTPGDMATGEFVFETINPARSPSRAAAGWPHTSPSGLSRAASISACRRACTSPKRRSQRRRPDPRSHRTPRPRPHADREKGRQHLHVQHPSPG